MRPWIVVMALSAMACGPERVGAPVAGDGVERMLPESATEIVFAADFTQAATGPLVAGTSIELTFDEDRLPQCRAWKYGLPAWAIVAFYRIDGGEVRDVPVVMPNRAPEARIDLDRPGELELWFSNTDAFGCVAWDSRFGANYRFDVLPERVVPGWMGDASSVITRETCGGTFCEGSLRPLDEGLLYDTWARQRALVAETTFQVWAPGVTDASADVWELLDARIHWAGADLVELGWDWVAIHDRPGNDVRYAYGLRDLDPLGGNTVTDPADCPDVPLRRTADGMYVEADLWVWFSVNGAELRPGSGGAWVATFQDYAGLYQICP